MRHDLAPLRIAVKPIVGHIPPPEMVDSFAGVGFWYIPNRVGGFKREHRRFLYKSSGDTVGISSPAVNAPCTLVDYDDRHTFSLLPEQLIKKG